MTDFFPRYWLRNLPWRWVVWPIVLFVLIGIVVEDWIRTKQVKGVCLLLASCSLLAGCTSTYVTYTTPNGSELSVHRRSALTKAEMPSVRFNPDGSVELIGYKSDQTEGVTEAIRAACKSAVEGAVQGAIGK